MKTYAYRIYKNTLNNPIIGGTVHANSMEHATQTVIKANNVNVVHESYNGYEYHYFELNSSRVGILIYANPGEF